MTEKASIRFHKIKHCGLYRERGRSPEMGSLRDIIRNIYNWSNVNGRLIQNTCTYEVNSAFDMDFLETYLVSMKYDIDSGDYFIAMWNRTHDSGDSVYALDPTATIGNLNKKALHKGDLPSKSIPGHATYFWIIPSKQTIATITFGTPRTGMNPFSHWFESFIKTESKYVRFDDKDKFIGYSKNTKKPIKDLVPRFTRSLHKNPFKKDLILENRIHILGVIRRIRLDRSQPAHKGAVERLLGLVGIANKSDQIPHTIPLTYELDYTPTESELTGMISSYENSESWEDVGFKFSSKNGFGADRKEWLSKSYSKGKIHIEVDWLVPGQLLDMAKLKTVVSKRRDELMELIPSNKVQDES